MTNSPTDACSILLTTPLVLLNLLIISCQHQTHCFATYPKEGIGCKVHKLFFSFFIFILEAYGIQLFIRGIE